MNSREEFKILLVDDDKDFANLVKTWLKPSGYNLSVCHSAKAGLECVAQEIPDLILLDLLMPEINGYEFCERLHLNNKDSIPVIFLTGVNDMQSKIAALKLGAVAYVTKPSSKTDLTLLIEKHRHVLEHRQAGMTTPGTQSHPNLGFSDFKGFIGKSLSFSAEQEKELTQVHQAQFFTDNKLFGLTEEKKAQLIASFCDFAYYSYVNPEQIELGVLSSAFCRHYLVVPIRDENQKLVIVMANPFQLEIYDILKMRIQNEYFSIGITHFKTIQYLFGTSSSTPEPNSAIQYKNSSVQTKDGDVSSHAVQVMDDIVLTALTHQASEIQIEPKNSHFDIRFILNGKVKCMYALETQIGTRVLSRFKSLGGIESTENQIPQEGWIEFKVDANEFNIKISTASTPRGERLLLRISGGRLNANPSESEPFVKTSEVEILNAQLTQARNEAEVARLQLQAILGSATNIAIIATDTHGMIKIFNRGAEKMLGWEAREMIDQKTPEAFHLQEEIERRGETLSREFGKSISGLGVFVAHAKHNRTDTNEWTFIRKDKLPITVHLVVTAIQDSNGKITGFLGIATDVTERKKVFEEIQKASAAALEASRAKSDFLATMSHEIRTPMNAILGMAELLTETTLTDEQNQYIKTLSRAGDTLLELINDILDLSKIESGVIDIESAPYSIKDTVERAVEIMAIPAHRKGIELTSLIDPEIPDALQGDSARIRQILINLISNAIKFTEKGEVGVELSLDKNQFTIAVRDTGIGIPADKISKLFSPFTQADSSTTRKYGGTGLGLSISKKLVELMGGKISFESRVGFGSRFYFTLPVRLPEAPDTSLVVESENIPIDLRGKKVLIVDDNATNLLIVNKALTKWGMEVTEAQSGEDCLKILLNNPTQSPPFDMIILDCRMPGMGGFEVAERLRIENPLTSQLPMILMLTSDNRSGDMDRVKQLKFNAYLVKPIRRCELLKIITSVLCKKVGTPENARPVLAQTPVLDLDSVSKKSILLAEDSADNRMLIKAYLKNQPYEIDIAENGKIALQMAFEKNYDLVLMDMQMPEMDGFTATRLIREKENKSKSRHNNIIALTANALKKDEEKCLNSGCDAYLSKPIKKSVLLDAIVKYSSREIATRNAA